MERRAKRVVIEREVFPGRREYLLLHELHE